MATSSEIARLKRAGDAVGPTQDYWRGGAGLGGALTTEI